MKAAEAWAALCRAGVTLEEDGGGLALRVPADVDPSPWLALGQEFGAHLYPLVSGAWRAEVAGWPEGMRDEWDERAALCAFESGLSCDEAERVAFLEVRERVLAPYAATFEALGRELGAVLVRVEARPAEVRSDEERTGSAPSQGEGTALPPLVRSPAWPCRVCGQRMAVEGVCSRCGGRSPRRAEWRVLRGGALDGEAMPVGRRAPRPQAHAAPLRATLPFSQGQSNAAKGRVEPSRGT